MNLLIAAQLVCLALASSALEPDEPAERTAAPPGAGSPPEPGELAAMPVVYRLPGMDQVSIRADLKYTSASDPLLLMDVYLPQDGDGGARRPAVVFIHGGVPPGSPAKNMGTFRSWGRLAAASGMVGITFTHRLGYPVPRLQEAHDDVNAAIEYVRAHADDFNLDKSRMCLAAFSGGGPLLASAMRDRPSHVRCLVGFYVFLDIQHSTLYTTHENADVVRAFSPIAGLSDQSREFVPMFIARAGLDEIPGLNDSIDRFLSLGLSANVPITFVNHPRGVHGFDTRTDDATSREIIRGALDFMRRSLELEGSAGF